MELKDLKKGKVALFKYKGAKWSTIFEIHYVRESVNGLARNYVIHQGHYHYETWMDMETISKYEFVDWVHVGDKGSEELSLEV